MLKKISDYFLKKDLNTYLANSSICFWYSIREIW